MKYIPLLARSTNLSLPSASLSISLQGVELLLDLYNLDFTHPYFDEYEYEEAFGYANISEKIASKSYQSQRRVLLRSSIILIMSAWEQFIETALTLSFSEALQNATDPKEIQPAFNTVAGMWYENISSGYPHKPKPPDFEKWTGSEWKKLLKERFERELSALNTPSGINLDKLSKRYLGVKLSEGWSWKGVSSERAQQRLDALINLRGALAHTFSPKPPQLNVRRVIQALNLITNMAICTEKALNLPLIDIPKTVESFQKKGRKAQLIYIPKGQ